MEKLDILDEDISELSKDVGRLLESSAITLNHLDCLVSREQSEYIITLQLDVNTPD